MQVDVSSLVTKGRHLSSLRYIHVTFGFLYIRRFQKPVWVLPIHNAVVFISDLSRLFNGVMYCNPPFLFFPFFFYCVTF
jgi:hypothetical protein